MGNEHQGSFYACGKEPVIGRIAELIRKHASRSAAARAWGININTLNSYFKNEAPTPMPRENILQRIADSEGVTLEWLKSGNEKTPKTPRQEAELVTTADAATNRLVELFSLLQQEDRDNLVRLFSLKGIETVLALLDSVNLQFLQLPNDEKDRLIALHEAKKGALETSEGNELTHQTKKAG